MKVKFLTLALIFNAVPTLACSLEAVSVTPEGFGLVKIGMTLPEAAKATGGAVREAEYNRPSEECYYGQYVNHDEAVMNMVVDKDKITAFEVYEPHINTPEKVGVGSTTEAVKDAYKGKWKATPQPDTDERNILVEDSSGYGYLFVMEAGKVVQYNAGILSAAINGIEGCL